MYLNWYLPTIGYRGYILPPAPNVYDHLVAAAPANADPHRRRIQRWLDQALKRIRKRAAGSWRSGQIVYTGGA